MPAIISIVGRSQSGKTTLIEKLIPEIKRRGYRVGTIKHTHHALDIDKTGKDSARHRQAGADTTILAAPGEIALLKSGHSDQLGDLIGFFDDVDLLITEGYKRSRRPKIEVVRVARNPVPFCKDDPHLKAVVTDAPLALGIPSFGLDDIGRIVDFIESSFLAPDDA
jgi:molybdopterin-guanine dinucleotide biosynthesis protein B